MMNLSVSLSLDKAELRLPASAAHCLRLAGRCPNSDFRHWRRSSLLPLIGKPSDEEMKPCGMPKPPLGRKGGIAQR